MGQSRNVGTHFPLINFSNDIEQTCSNGYNGLWEMIVKYASEREKIKYGIIIVTITYFHTVHTLFIL